MKKIIAHFNANSSPYHKAVVLGWQVKAHNVFQVRQVRQTFEDLMVWRRCRQSTAQSDLPLSHLHLTNFGQIVARRKHGADLGIIENETTGALTCGVFGGWNWVCRAFALLSSSSLNSPTQRVVERHAHQALAPQRPHRDDPLGPIDGKDGDRGTLAQTHALNQCRGQHVNVLRHLMGGRQCTE